MDGWMDGWMDGQVLMMRSGPFSGAQDTPIRRRVQREGATWIGSVAKWHLKAIICAPGRFGAGGWGWVLLGPTGRCGAGCSWEVWGWGMGLGAPGPDGQALPRDRPEPWVLLGVMGLGDGAGCSWARWAGAPRNRSEPCSPSIRKRCACGFPQGTAEPLRHASNNRGSCLSLD